MTRDKVFKVAKTGADLTHFDLKEEILSAIEDRWAMLNLQLDQLERTSRMFEERLRVTARIAELEHIRQWIEGRERI